MCAELPGKHNSTWMFTKITIRILNSIFNYLTINNTNAYVYLVRLLFVFDKKKRLLFCIIYYDIYNHVFEHIIIHTIY